MSHRAIASLAIVKVQWDEGANYIDNFLSFVGEALKLATQEQVSLSEIQKIIEDNFGIHIPQGALNTILNRAAQKNYVKKVNKVFFRNTAFLSSVSFFKEREDAIRQQNYLLENLKIFVKTFHNQEWTLEKCEQALISYLHKYSIAILSTSVDGRPLLIGETDQKNEKELYFVQSFVSKLHESDPTGFEYVETVVKGLMLSDVLYLPELGKVDQKFRGVKFILDTNFILRALGLAGPSLQAPNVELIDLIYELNGDLECFEHTLAEVRGILYGAQQAASDIGNMSGHSGETIEYLVRAKFSPTDIEIMSLRLEESLRELGIKVVQPPPFSQALSLDEAKMQEILQNVVNYFKPESLQHDLKSLTAIHRLRRGRAQYTIENSEAIFVTTNENLVHASKIFFKEDTRGAAIPHCILDDALTAIVWLKKPLKAPELPQKRIIADCYAAIHPSHELWRKYLDAIVKLRRDGDIDEKDFYILRCSIEAKRILVEKTQGDPSAFTKGSPMEVLEEAKKQMTAEMAQEISSQKQLVMTQEVRAELAEKKIGDTLLRIKYVSRKMGSWFSRGISTILTIVLVLSSFASFFGIVIDFQNIYLNSIFAGTSFVLAVLNIVNALNGMPIMSFTKWLEIKISQTLEKYIKYFINID